jgi:hypothetical protein
MRCRVRTTFVVAAAALLLPISLHAEDKKPAAATPPAAASQPTATASAAPPPAEAPAPAAATAPATPAPAEPGANAPATSQGSYTVRLHDLERRVNELKEQIFRSKARLNLLKETVLHGVIAGARAVITHRNEMGAMYTPIRYVYALDGQEIYAKADESGKLGDQKEIEVFNGSITPGNHTLSVQMIYQGNGFGVFSYLKGYKFIARSSRTFTAPEGKQLQLKVVGFEKGNPVTTDPKDRPAVDFRESLVADKDTLPKSSAPAKK